MPALKRRNETTVHKSGFSLVELSIVLVILGLLVGGILGGQSLIRAAELRSITTEYDQWQTAINNFRLKYRAIPGDMKIATRLWEDAGVCDEVEDETHLDPLDGTCNGNGNGVVFKTGHDRYERFLFWQHLQLAGLVPGHYSGVRGPDTAYDTVPDVNAPSSKLGDGSMWYSAYASIYLDSPTTLFKRDYSNALVLENEEPEWGNLLTSEEAWSIDTKLDDGRPGTGVVVSNRSDGNCSNADELAGSPDEDEIAQLAEYLLSESGAVCSLYFIPPR